MKPVDMTQFHDPENGVIGNCYRACIASLLECNIDDIPPVERAMYDDEDWWTPMQEWLREGYGLYFITIPSSDYIPPGYHLGIGPSSRGAQHCVIYRGEEMIHDPHPTREGLVKREHVEILIPLDPRRS